MKVNLETLRVLDALHIRLLPVVVEDLKALADGGLPVDEGLGEAFPDLKVDLVNFN